MFALDLTPFQKAPHKFEKLYENQKVARGVRITCTPTKSKHSLLYKVGYGQRYPELTSIKISLEIMAKSA